MIEGRVAHREIGRAVIETRFARRVHDAPRRHAAARSPGFIEQANLVAGGGQVVRASQTREPGPDNGDGRRPDHDILRLA
jgi:hypothetical protein